MTPPEHDPLQVLKQALKAAMRTGNMRQVSAAISALERRSDEVFDERRERGADSTSPTQQTDEMRAPEKDH
jgi:hypothetical protein